MNPSYYITFFLFDKSELGRFNRYIRYNDDLIYQGSTLSVWEPGAVVTLVFEYKGLWLVNYLLDQFDTLRLSTQT